MTDKSGLPYPPVFHIGFHKTATSYLQNVVFSDTSRFAQPWTIRSGEAVEHFLLCHPERFDPALIRSALLDGLEADARVPVVSHENLSGDPIHGQYYLESVAKRIHATFPEARIVIGVREQKALIGSLYLQYIKQGGTRSLSELLTVNRDRTGFRPVVRFDHLEFDLAVGLYSRLFSPEHVLVLPYEMLSVAPRDYFRRLGDFTGLTWDEIPAQDAVNAGRLDTVMRVERQLNKLLSPPRRKAPRYSDNPILYRARNRGLRVLNDVLAASPFAGYGKDRLKREVATHVGDYFAASNGRLEAATKLDLKALGYDVGT